MRTRLKTLAHTAVIVYVLVLAFGCASQTKPVRPGEVAASPKNETAAPSPVRAVTAKLCKGCSCPGSGRAHTCTCGAHMACMR